MGQDALPAAGAHPARSQHCHPQRTPQANISAATRGYGDPHVMKLRPYPCTQLCHVQLERGTWAHASVRSLQGPSLCKAKCPSGFSLTWCAPTWLHTSLSPTGSIGQQQQRCLVNTFGPHSCHLHQPERSVALHAQGKESETKTDFVENTRKPLRHSSNSTHCCTLSVINTRGIPP